ncbi:MAG: regulatory protein RecX [Pseudomonadota bacterium]
MADDEHREAASGVDSTEEPAVAEKSPAEIRTAVMNSAVRLLARREHSRTELRNKLLLRGQPIGIIDSVIDQLAEQGLQSDERFAESYTRMRIRRGYGSNKIRVELQARDVARDIIEKSFAETDECWIENATHVLAKKFLRNKSFDSSLRALAKMQRFLWSRGYNSEQVKIAIERLREQ